ncbi:MAG: hypothetical protein ABIP33_06510 [Pseudolysinimonas sp.]
MPTNPLDMLAVIARLTTQRGDLIREARQLGATWEEIAASLNMSVMGVRNLARK